MIVCIITKIVEGSFYPAGYSHIGELHSIGKHSIL